MESIIEDSIMLHLLLKIICYLYHQHGFRKGHSTRSQLLECLNYFTSALEEDDYVDALH